MITINNLEHHFGNKLLFHQNDAIKINEGINYLVGANGSGKTTFLKILVGLILPSHGTIQYDNASITETLKKIGIIFDQPFFYPYLTGLENLNFFNDCSDHKVNREVINELFVQWRISDEKTKYKHYSLGMKRKLSIVLSLLKEPNYWFLDEPFNGLDFDTQHSLVNTLNQMKKDGKTIILSAHNMENNIEIADHVIAIREGIIHYYPNVSKKLRNVFTHKIEIENVNKLPPEINDHLLAHTTLGATTILTVNAADKNTVLNLLEKADMHIVNEHQNENTLSAILEKLEVMEND